MIGILVITHEDLGEHLIRCASHVVGMRPPQLMALGVFIQDDPDAVLVKARDMIQQLDSGALRQALHDDPVLGPLHQAAVAWRQARFRQLMQEDEWRSFYGQLLMAGPTRVLDRAEAESIWRPHIGRATTSGSK